MNLSRLSLILLSTSALAAGATTPLWLRDIAISPDGAQVAFTYKGDIWTVPTSGGTAKRLTSAPSYESVPIWSPDSKSIAFSSDREGRGDVYIMSAQGGTPRRLTYNSVAETPEAFTPDGKSVIFSAAIQAPAKSAQFPSSRLSQLYKISADGNGHATQLLGTPARHIAMLKDKSGAFVYEDVKGMEDVWRKHHTSSVTRDIWVYNPATKKHTNLTNHPGEDLWPTVSPDGKTLYFLSERNGGSANVYSMPVNGGEVKTLTTFERHPVRFLTIADNGTMAFGFDGEIYRMTEGGKPEKLAIDVTLDDVETPSRISARRPSSGAVSPDGKQFAYVSRGEVFVTSVEHSSVKKVTDTPEGESNVTWGRDSRELFYTSERDGHYDIYRASIARPDDPNFSNATIISEERVVKKDDGMDRTYPVLSPDGKKLAFIEDRNKLMVMELATKKTRQLTDGTTHPSRSKGFQVQWSPDSRMILIENTRATHQPYSDISVIDVESGKIHDITQSGYFDQTPHWALDGKAVIWLSERYGMRNHASWGSLYDVMIAFLDREAYDRFRLSPEDFALLKEVEKERAKNKKKSAEKQTAKKDKKKTKQSVLDDSNETKDETEKTDNIAYDFDGIEERTIRLTPNSSDIVDAFITSDGETLYYLSAIEKGYDLWKSDLRKKDTKLLKKLDLSPSELQSDKDGNIFIVGKDVKKFAPKSEKLTSVTLGGTITMDRTAEREYMLRHVFNEERERFYVKDMNGVDWEGLYNDYKRFLPHISNNYDFAELLSELLGELNVSHTGGRYYAPAAGESTASLGLLYDVTYAGDGLKIEEVVVGGPADHANSIIRPGEVIKAINSTEISNVADASVLLAGAAGKKTLLTLADGREEVVIPISASKFSDLMYDRWVRGREAAVDKLSGGRLGYVHLESMSDDSFRKIYSKVMGKFRNREGIVIDTRWNGGGRLHEDIEVLFSAEPYLTQDIHGMVTSVMPSRRWTKPSIMVTGEANYSNAHGTPWVYKHKGLGKLVGMPVPGTMSSVNWVTLQDPTLIFGIPVIGFRTAEGNYLENTQLEPDIKVANDATELSEGRDRQLEVAVAELLKEIDVKNKTK